MLTRERLESSSMRNNPLICKLLTLMRAKDGLKDHISGSIALTSGGLPPYRLSLYFGRNYYGNALQKDVPRYCEVHKQQTWQLQIQPSGPNFVFLIHVDCSGAQIYQQIFPFKRILVSVGRTLGSIRLSFLLACHGHYGT